MTVPGGYRVRGGTSSDAAAVATLIRLVDPVEPVAPDDLTAWWRTLDLERDVRIVEDEHGQAVASLEVNPRPGGRVFAEIFVHPEHTGRGLGSELLRLSEERAAEVFGGRGRILNGLSAKNARGRALLERRGYRLVRHFWRMAIDLNEVPPAPEWPEGLTPRPYRPADDRRFYETLNDAFADHWDHQPDTYEHWQQRHPEDEDHSLWLGVWDGDELAAAMTCSPLRYGRGWIDALGVRPPWRRRGIARALLRHAFAEFWRRGQSGVGLGVDAESETGATQLYESVGMYVLFEIASYEKTLG